jgi:putative ubiquitin-RnfH superfamily antitoxin RatB of RatAB toxin-antitoxin module
MPDETLLRVEVAVAWPELQVVVELALAAGSTVAEAIEASALQQRFPQLEVVAGRVGIFSEICDMDRALRDGDRVEIYRPLEVDPKEARRRAAEARRNDA